MGIYFLTHSCTMVQDSRCSNYLVPDDQGGTWRYKAIQGKYREVQGGTEHYLHWYMSVQVGTYGYVLSCQLFIPVQLGHALLLNLLLQFCPAESAVFETSAASHTNARKNHFLQSDEQKFAKHFPTFCKAFLSFHCVRGASNPISLVLDTVTTGTAVLYPSRF